MVDGKKLNETADFNLRIVFMFNSLYVTIKTKLLLHLYTNHMIHFVCYGKVQIVLNL